MTTQRNRKKPRNSTPRSSRLPPVNTLKKHPETRQPIWQIAQEIMEDVPPEIIDQLPSDGAEQHDHYIYGTPKHE